MAATPVSPGAAAAAVRIRNLIQAIKQWQQAGSDIFLGGNFNEQLGETQDGLAHLVTKCGLVNIHATHHSTLEEPNTYGRGTKRVEYVFMFPHAIPFVDLCSIDTFHFLIHSDHCGLFIDVEFQGLPGGIPALIQAPKMRGISSKANEPSLYVMAIQKHLLNNNVFANAAKMLAATQSQVGRVSSSQGMAINKIDTSITRTLLIAKHKCRRKP